ncbi:hypothetical protein TNCT_476321 [Trichonephila clavata]|uniref:C2H2-type domain-containing protein n=1 Tax=Trichonephila clavata TaxID=2740835 RepID=A0A8X6L0T2_TRICU|nr:hypothetical protein TNCT_476321 [Trichonephila clavata]
MCQATFKSKPYRDNCLKESGLFSDQTSGLLNWVCNECGVDFPSKIGLANHSSSHKKSEIRENEVPLFIPAPPKEKRVSRRQRVQQHSEGPPSAAPLAAPASPRQQDPVGEQGVEESVLVDIPKPEFLLHSGNPSINYWNMTTWKVLLKTSSELQKTSCPLLGITSAFALPIVHKGQMLDERVKLTSWTHKLSRNATGGTGGSSFGTSLLHNLTAVPSQRKQSRSILMLSGKLPKTTYPKRNLKALTAPQLYKISPRSLLHLVCNRLRTQPLDQTG